MGKCRVSWSSGKRSRSWHRRSSRTRRELCYRASQLGKKLWRCRSETRGSSRPGNMRLDHLAPWMCVTCSAMANGRLPLITALETMIASSCLSAQCDWHHWTFEIVCPQFTFEGSAHRIPHKHRGRRHLPKFILSATSCWTVADALARFTCAE